MTVHHIQLFKFSHVCTWTTGRQVTLESIYSTTGPTQSGSNSRTPCKGQKCHQWLTGRSRSNRQVAWLTVLHPNHSIVSIKIIHHFRLCFNGYVPGELGLASRLTGSLPHICSGWASLGTIGIDISTGQILFLFLSLYWQCQKHWF